MALDTLKRREGLKMALDTFFLEKKQNKNRPNNGRPLDPLRDTFKASHNRLQIA